MAWAFVQTPVGTHTASAGTTVARAMPSNPTIGSKIVVGTSWNLGTGSATVADTLLHTYTAIPSSLVNDGGATASLQWFWADVTATGANTVTATFPSNPQHDIYVYEMSGLQAGAADTAATGTSAAGNSTATFTTTAANDFIVVQTVNLGAPAPPAGYTLRISGTTFQRSWTKDDPTAAGSVANTETGGGGGSLSAVAFKITGGATAVLSPPFNPIPFMPVGGP
jgi:hypothetical protein